MTRRAPEAGVTLIEMLAVLALFAIIAGAVVLALPGQRTTTQSNLSILALATRLTAAVDQNLTTGQAFGIWTDGDDLIVLEKSNGGAWTPSSDPRLNPVKLSARHVRMSFQDGDERVFWVSSALVPNTRKPLSVAVSGRQTIEFDGLSVRTVTPEAANGETISR